MKAAKNVENEKLDRVIMLLEYLVALDLARGGITHAEIGKHLTLAKASVGKMLKGYNNEG